jgi:16S rRNA (guanine966-N2)-methyltransferase
LRVVAGTFKGRRLAAPRGTRTRPTADRVREALFSMLGDVSDARVLDLFAGSGALGIEALSRGAASATFVEHDAGAATVIRSNLVRARLDGPAATVVRDDAPRWLRRVPPPDGPFDLVVIDPPYDRPELLLSVLDALGPVLAPGARVVAKHFWRDAPPARVGLLASDRERRFGETALTFYTRQEDR